jgi:hypothetical protein
VNEQGWKLHRKAVCERKVRYRSRHIADTAAWLLAMQPRQKRRHTYQCPVCKLFHHTSNPKKAK